MRNKTTLYGIGALLAVILGAGFLSFTGINIAGANISGIQSVQLKSNLCPLSSSNVRINSNDPVLNGVRDIIVTVGTNCGDSVIQGGALIKKQSLQGKNANGQTVKAKTGFKLGAISYDPYAYYIVGSSNTRIVYKPVLHKIKGTGSYGDLTQSELQQCRNYQQSGGNSALDKPYIPPNPTPSSINDYSSYITGGYYSSTLNCFSSQKIAVTRNIQSSSHSGFNATFKMCGSGTCGTKTVNARQASGGFHLSTRRYTAHINYDGILPRNLIAPNLDTSKWVAVCTYNCEKSSSASYSLTSTSIISNYKQGLINFGSLSRQAVSNNNPQSAVSTFTNKYASPVLVNKKTTVRNSIGSWVKSLQFNNNKLMIRPTSSQELGSAHFTIRIPSDWAGLYIPMGHAKITNAPNFKITARSSTTEQITVKNTGQVGSLIHASLQCPTPLNGGSSESRISAGSTHTFDIGVTAGGSNGQTVSCTATAKDVNANNIQSSINVQATVKKSQINIKPVTPPSTNTSSGSSSSGSPQPKSNRLSISTVVLAGAGLLTLLILGVLYIFRKPLLKYVKRLTGL